MKFKVMILSVLVLLISAGSFSAQPRCSPNFNPFDSCNYSPNDQHILLGQVISVSETNNKLLPDSRLKVVVEVEKTLKGNSAGRVEIFLDYRQCGYDPIYENSNYIFIAKEKSLEAVPILYAERWSFSANDYTEQDKNEVFSMIRARLKNIKVTTILGTVVSPKEVSKEIKDAGGSIDKMTLKLGYYNRFLSPVAGMTVEARREEDGKVFQSVTNEEGNYFFTDLTYGRYKVYPVLSEDYDKPFEYLDIGSTECQSKKVFQIVRTASLDGSLVSP